MRALLFRLLPLLAAALGACTSDATGLLQPVGAACALNVDCESALCIPESLDGTDTGWPGGACSASCDDTSCPTGQVCAILADGGWCVPDCTSTPCRTGYVCSAELHGCLPDCRLGWSCGDTLVCGPSGECEAPAPPPTPCRSNFECPFGQLCGADATCQPSTGTNPIGAACADPAECASAFCFTMGGGGMGGPGTGHGVCSRPCAAGPCPEATSCTPLGPAQMCLPSCALGCPAGTVCEPSGVGCVPSCLSGWTCPPIRPICGGDGLCTAG